MNDTIYNVTRRLNSLLKALFSFQLSVVNESYLFYLYFDLSFVWIIYKSNLLGIESEKKSSYAEQTNLAQGIFRNES